MPLSCCISFRCCCIVKSLRKLEFLAGRRWQCLAPFVKGLNLRFGDVVQDLVQDRSDHRIRHGHFDAKVDARADGGTGASSRSSSSSRNRHRTKLPAAREGLEHSFARFVAIAGRCCCGCGCCCAAVADRFDPQAFGIDGHPGKIPRSEHRSERSESHHQFGLEGPGPSVVSNGFGNDLALAAEGQEVLVSVHVLDDPKQLQGMDVAQKPRFDPVGSSPGGRCNVGASASASTRTPARSSGTTTGTGTKAPANRGKRRPRQRRNRRWFRFRVRFRRIRIRIRIRIRPRPRHRHYSHLAGQEGG
mmetsp:Transcript_3421/g.7479  ORF Transcript_3421/g.7479 Transcript_3421/m.7479 type:complete len:303 (-) Transcript_3421:60-968(-)